MVSSSDQPGVAGSCPQGSFRVLCGGKKPNGSTSAFEGHINPMHSGANFLNLEMLWYFEAPFQKEE